MTDRPTPDTRIRARDGRGRVIRSIETVQQDKRAAELRSGSFTYAQIAEQLGIGLTTAKDAVRRGFAMVADEDLETAKAIQRDKFDRTERYLTGVMLRDHIKVDHGRIIEITVDGEDGPTTRPLLDDRPGIQAAQALIRLWERRARFEGFDAPTRARVEVITPDLVRAEIERVSALLGESPDDPDGPYPDAIEA
jgi:hypothetical protein